MDLILVSCNNWYATCNCKFPRIFLFCLKISNWVETLYTKINFKDQYHFTSSGILNVQRLFRCRDDWYQWGGSGDSGLAPGPPQRVTWNEGVHQSITNCSLVPRLSRWAPTKSLDTRLHKLLWHIREPGVSNLLLIWNWWSFPGLIPVRLLCTLLHIKKWSAKQKLL